MCTLWIVALSKSYGFCSNISIKLAFLSFHLAQYLFPVLCTMTLVILTIYLAWMFGSIYFGSIYCFDLYRLLHRLSTHQSYTCYIYNFITIPLYIYIETSMNYLTLTIYFTKSWLFFDILCSTQSVFSSPTFYITLFQLLGHNTSHNNILTLWADLHKTALRLFVRHECWISDTLCLFSEWQWHSANRCFLQLKIIATPLLSTSFWNYWLFTAEWNRGGVFNLAPS